MTPAPSGLPDFLEVLAAAAARTCASLRGRGAGLLLPRSGEAGCRVLAPDGLSQRVIDALAGPSGGVVFSAARRLGVPITVRGGELPPEARRLKSALRKAGADHLVIVPLRAGPEVAACIVITREDPAAGDLDPQIVAQVEDPAESSTGTPEVVGALPTTALDRLWLSAGVRLLGALLDDWHADPGSLPHGGVVVDRVGRILFAFGAAHSLPGWAQADLVGQLIGGLPGGNELMALVAAPTAQSPAEPGGGPWVASAALDEAADTPVRVRGLGRTASCGARAVLVRDPASAFGTPTEGARAIQGLAETLHEALETDGIGEYRAGDPLACVLRLQGASEQIRRARDCASSMGAPVGLDFNDVIRRWTLAEGSAVRAQGIRILSLLAPELSLAAGDPVEVSRALRALLRDARAALLPAGGTITLRTWEDDGYLHCAVANDGSGMGAGRPSTAFRALPGPEGLRAAGACEAALQRAGQVFEALGGRLDVEVRPRVWTRRTVLVPASVVGPTAGSWHEHIGATGAVRPISRREVAQPVEE